MADQAKLPDSRSSDERLDPEAFASRFESSARTLWCIAAAILPDRSLIDDVLQEAAIVGLRKLLQFDPATSFIAWMGQIVRYVALNQARRLAGSPDTSVDPQTLRHAAIAEPCGDETPLRGDGRLRDDREPFDDEVIAALGSLDHTARARLLLRTLLDMPYREIALALDLPEGTAMSHVHRARRAMRERIATSTRWEGPAMRAGT